ncbi:MAG TPA: ABC transporter substrate-binding protein [Myxococcaceae bacterium]|nr:ABC transporter substrate-binding protein [Myxococcaceae bacterium]
MKTLLLTLILGATEPGSATAALKARDAEIRAALPAKGEALTPAQRQKMENILTRAVDLEGVAKAALGKNWDDATPAQRKKFLDAFKQRFRKATADEFTDDYRGTEVKYLPEQPDGDGVKVPTEIVIKGEPTRIDYVMRKQGTEWRITDIVVDDVSTVENYRSSFGRIIKKEGMNGLIARLNKGTVKQASKEAN